MSDDTPTQRFDQPVTPPSGQQGQRKKRGPLIPILITVGALLVIVIVVLATLLLTRPSSGTLADSTNSPSPSASSSPSQTPVSTPVVTPTPTASATHNAPPPPSNTLRINSFLVNNSTHPVIYCNTQAPDPQPINIGFSWATQNATNVYFGVGTTDAQAGALFSMLPASGTNANFPPGETTYTYPCPAHSELFTLTIVNNSGGKVNRSVTLINKGDQM